MWFDARLTRGEETLVCEWGQERPSSWRTRRASCLGVLSTRPPGFPRRHRHRHWTTSDISVHTNTSNTSRITTRKPSVEVAPTTLAKKLADRGKFSAGCYVFSVLNSGPRLSRGRLLAVGDNTVDSCFLLWLWILTHKLDRWTDLDGVKMNQHAKYLDQRWFRSDTHTHTHTHTHTPDRLLYVDHWSGQ